MSDIKAAEPSIVFSAINPPEEVQSIFKTEKKTVYTVSWSTVLSITFLLPGSNIPIRIRGVKFYVVDQDMDEVILSRGFLKSIGFDFKKHMETVHEDIHDKSVADLNADNVKLAAIYQGMAYQDADDDPIELIDAVSAYIGQDSKETIDSAFQKILTQAEGSGITEFGHKRL